MHNGRWNVWFVHDTSAILFRNGTTTLTHPNRLITPCKEGVYLYVYVPMLIRHSRLVNSMFIDTNGHENPVYIISISVFHKLPFRTTCVTCWCPGWSNNCPHVSTLIIMIDYRNQYLFRFTQFYYYFQVNILVWRTLVIAVINLIMTYTTWKSNTSFENNNYYELFSREETYCLDFIEVIKLVLHNS